MADVRGQLLPIYMVADESASMEDSIDELNAGLASLHAALLAEPMAAAKVRFSVLGFSDDVVVRLHLADVRRSDELPALESRGRTNYAEVFETLLRQIPRDVAALKASHYQVHRPAVFFLSDGQPNEGGAWREAHRQLTDRSSHPSAPNIIACGIGQAEPETILRVATRSEFAFLAIEGARVGSAIATFCTALTRSIVASGRTMGSANAELVVDRPEGFRLAIDVI
jgi:uncharacterized protein YegL